MRKWFSTAVLVCFIAGVGTVGADEYEVGPEDVLSISFWQDPTLDTEVRVSLSGTISLDVIGEVEVAGKTPQQIEVEIVRRMSRLSQRISQAVVRVTQYNFQYVFVSGQVNQPGKQTFEEVPDLWSIINEAGGVTEFGDLSRVTIIRGGDDAGQVEIVNVAAAIAGGQLDKLPKIRRQDTIEIPRTPVGLPSATLGQNLERRNVIYVVGAVQQPGPIAYEENVDVLEAVALAGGHTNEADMKRARIITKDSFYGQSLHQNLDMYIESGALARYNLRKEDIVVIPHRGTGFFSGFNLITIGSIVGVISTGVLIYTQLDED